MKIKMWWTGKKPKVVKIDSKDEIEQKLNDFAGKKDSFDNLNYEVYYDNGQLANC